jgi:hypothetical protein
MEVSGKPHAQTALLRSNKLHYPLNRRARRHSSRSRRCGEEMTLVPVGIRNRDLILYARKNENIFRGRPCLLLPCSVFQPTGHSCNVWWNIHIKIHQEIFMFVRVTNRKRNGTDSNIIYSVSYYANAPQMAQHLNYAAH